MTKVDFDKIIQTSREHLTKQTYFEAQRVAFKCLPQEYGRELIVAFKRFNDAIPKDTFKEMLHHVSRNIRFPLQTMSNLPWDNRKYYEFDYHSFFCDSDGTKFFPDELGDEMDNLWRELNAYVQSIDSGTNTTEQGKKLTLNQIALKYVYEGKSITRDNGDEIAKLYGFNSGEKLFQWFTFFSSPANRKAKPTTCTPKKMKNKIELFESVINILPESNKSRVEDELKILKKIYESEYQ